MIEKTARPLMARVVLLMVLFVALISFSVYYTVNEANKVEATNSQKSVEAALVAKSDQMAMIARDNGFWDDAVKAIYGTSADPDFIWSSWGSATLDATIYDSVVVIDRSGNTILAFDRGKPRRFDALASAGLPLKRLLDATDSQAKPQGGIVATPGGIAIVGVAQILPTSQSLERMVPVGGPSWIAFGHHLTDAELAATGATLQISNLHFGAPAPGETSIPLRDSTNRIVSNLSWTAQRPGLRALDSALPPIVGAALMHLLLVALLIIQGSRYLAALRQQALIDSLSGLPNRRMIRKELERELKSGKRVALAMFDLDGFKGVNDNFGHQVGDRLIKELSTLFLDFVGEEGMVARLGGDEFAVMVTGRDGVERINAISQRTLARFAQPFRIDERTVTVGVSIGIASAGVSHFDAGELMRRADVAMYAAKRAGKMRISWYDEMLDQLQAKAHGLESEMRTALEREEFKLVYQPIFALDGLSVRAVETLLRWTNGTRGEISASEFIPVAEETGLIDRIGQWVIQRACEDALAWQDVQLNINVSPAQLRNPDFARNLQAILDATGFPAERLELEITERYLILDPEIAARVIEEIRSIGVHITLDEYGSGFTSIGFLRKFSLAKIKIDQNLVKEAQWDEEARTILQASITVGRALNMSIIAGGVETADQADLMRIAGCDQLQGWHFSKAQTAAQITRRLARSRPSAKVLRLRTV